MVYCKKIGIECKYYNLCTNSIESYNGKNFGYIFNNISKVLLDSGIKKVWKIEQLKYKDLHKYISLYKKEYIYGIYTFNDDNNIVGNKMNNKTFIYLLANNNKYIKAFTYLDNSLKDFDRVVGTGLLLGYPKCCSLYHYNVSNSKSKSFYIDKKFDSIIYQKGIECPLINPILKLYVHIPCSNKCIGTIKNGIFLLNYLERKYGKDILHYYFYNVGIRL